MTSRLQFAKMHGLGNDFMVLDLVTQEATLDPGLVQSWSDRRTGIGFDQLLIVEPPSDPQADFWYRIYNADGSVMMANPREMGGRSNVWRFVAVNECTYLRFGFTPASGLRPSHWRRLRLIAEGPMISTSPDSVASPRVRSPIQIMLMVRMSVVT